MQVHTHIFTHVCTHVHTHTPKWNLFFFQNEILREIYFSFDIRHFYLHFWKLGLSETAAFLLWPRCGQRVQGSYQATPLFQLTGIPEPALAWSASVCQSCRKKILKQEAPLHLMLCSWIVAVCIFKPYWRCWASLRKTVKSTEWQGRGRCTYF